MKRKTNVRKSPAPSKPRTTAAPKKTTAKRVTRTAKKRGPAAPAPTRRAIFIDVENTSSEANLHRVLEYLKIDRKAQLTELAAVGNWRSVGASVARMLAGLGANLVHSAPAVGVRDWSDLWIAVAAGRWLATAKPGDTLEIVSDDRAFDAVLHAAAAAGVTFNRISYRAIPGAAEAHAVAAPPSRPQRRGGRRRRGRGTDTPHPHTTPAVTTGHRAETSPPAPTPARAATSDEEAHTASHEQIRAALARLTGGDSARWVNLDILANTLRSEGFTRPPGSPRLVTRLRKIKGVEVSPNGMVRLVGDAPEVANEAGQPEPTPRRRPRRRGGHRRRSARGRDAAIPANDTVQSE